jgi:hypothetical protein
VLGKGYINTLLRGLAALDSAKPPRNNLCLKLSTLLLKLRGLFIGSKKAIKALGNIENLDFNLLVKLGSNPCTNRNKIRPKLPLSVTGRFWHSGSPI